MPNRPSSCVVFSILLAAATSAQAQIGAELAVPQHLEDGDEFAISTSDLIAHGQLLFEAVWTQQEGGGRPQSKGTGAPLADPFSPLVFPRNFNRVSGPDSNSCRGCHNVPRTAGGGDVVANVFVLGERFDFATFDVADGIPTKGAVDEQAEPMTLQGIANSRNPPGLFGAGYIELLARQMTAELQSIRDGIASGENAPLLAKGVSFGVLARRGDGSWDTGAVEGLPFNSLVSSGASDPPTLIIRPFHQAGAVVSLREFTNSAFNQHHGIQSTERFGFGLDEDADGFADELTRADVTAATIFQAVLPVPGRVIPRNREVEQAVLRGEEAFVAIGCAECHIEALPLDDDGWVFSEPNPYNPPGNLQIGDAAALAVDLNDTRLPPPRLFAGADGVTWVPALTDLKLHDITSGAADPNREALDMQHPAGSPQFVAGNARFITRKLWGIANEPPFFHHGKYTTMRAAIEAHHGEAEAANRAWQALSGYDRDSIIEFLKTLQVLPAGSRSRFLDENGNRRVWPPGSEEAAGQGSHRRPS